MTNDAARPAPEVALGDDAIGDVTARAAADQDLRADGARPVEAQHAGARRRAGGEDRRGEARGASTDNDEIGGAFCWADRTHHDDSFDMARLDGHTRCNLLRRGRRFEVSAPSHFVD
jgi:hypothetical protein